jgi:hypothetical protein
MPEHVDCNFLGGGGGAGNAEWERLRTAHPEIERSTAACGFGWLPLVERFLTEAEVSCPRVPGLWSSGRGRGGACSRAAIGSSRTRARLIEGS